MLKLVNISVSYPCPTRQGNRLVRWITSVLPFLQRVQYLKAIQSISLEIEQNDFVVILGASGSGKSTLLQSIAGLIQPESGHVFIEGKDVAYTPPHLRNVGYVLQYGGWYDHLTVEEHLQNSSGKIASHKVSDAFGLKEFAGRYPSELSGGQQQRLAIARAFVQEKKILLMDEPLSQIDSHLRESVRKTILELHKSGKTILYVTHDQQDALRLASKIAVLDQGKLLQFGTPDQLYKEPSHQRVAELLGSPAMQFISGAEACSVFSLANVNHWKQKLGDNFVIGIRPEDWNIETNAASDSQPASIYDASMDTVHLMEESAKTNLIDVHAIRFLGRDTLVSCSPFEMLVPNSSRLATDLKVGDRVSLSVSFKKLHFFDSTTQEALPSPCN